MAEKGKSHKKGKYFAKKRQNGPPMGSDGHGNFKTGPLAKYREQPLPEMLSQPGIIVTAVQGKEGIAEREIMEALEEAADALYPDTRDSGNGSGSGEGNGNGSGEAEDEDEDIEDMLKKELAALSGGPGVKSARFRVTKRETACVAYVIVFKPLDPVALVQYIIEKCDRTARCGFRFIQRLTPITAVCGGYMDRLKTMAAEALVAPFAVEGGVTFAINANTRNSDKLKSLDMIKAVAEEVTKLSPEHKVDLSNPDKTILVELHKTRLGISVVTDFEKYKKFNPSRVAKDAAKALGQEGKADGTATERVAAATAAPAEETATIETEETTEPSEAAGRRLSKGQVKTANRERRAAGIASAAADAEAAKSLPAKRKAGETDGEGEELEDGQVAKAEDVERGEVVEDEKAQLGDEFEEVIEGGRVSKVRRRE